jgi:hypothetical protein
MLYPVLFALLIYAASGSRSVANSATMLLGLKMAYFTVGLGAATCIETMSATLDNPQLADIAVKFFLGIMLLCTALNFSNKVGPAKPHRGN